MCRASRPLRIAMVISKRAGLWFCWTSIHSSSVNSFARRSICEKASPQPLPMLRGWKEEPCKCAIMPWCDFYFSLCWAGGQRQPREEVGTSFEHIRVPAGRAAKQKISQKFSAFRRWTMNFQSCCGSLVTGGCMGSKITATWHKKCWSPFWWWFVGSNFTRWISLLRMKLIWTKVTWIAVAYLLGTFGALVTKKKQQMSNRWGFFLWAFIITLCQFTQNFQPIQVPFSMASWWRNSSNPSILSVPWLQSSWGFDGLMVRWFMANLRCHFIRLCGGLRECP